MYFNGRFLLNLIHFAELLGAQKEELLGLTGMPEDQLCMEDCKLPPEVYNKAVEKAVELTKDPLFGFHAGQHLNLSAAGLIVQIAQTSSTVKQALTYVCEFANLGCSALPTALVEVKEGFKLVLKPNGSWRKMSEEAVQQTILGYLAFSIKEWDSLVHSEIAPVKVVLDFSVGDRRAELESVMNTSVVMGQNENAIYFTKESVEKPVVTSDYQLLQMLVGHAQKKIIQLNDNNGFYETVKKSVFQLVKPQFPTIEQVANYLNMSVRSFQRKLKEEGYVYKEIIQKLRMELALEYLVKPSLSLREIAFLLDYTDTSSFTRAFSKYYGATPKNYRKKLIR